MSRFPVGPRWLSPNSPKPSMLRFHLSGVPVVDGEQMLLGIVTLSDTSEDCRSGAVVGDGVVAWTAHKPGSSDIIGVRVWEGSGAVKEFDNGGWVLDTDGRYVLWIEPATTAWRSAWMSARSCCNMSVSVNPGATVLTVIPYRASSAAAVRVNAVIPPLLAL